MTVILFGRRKPLTKTLSFPVHVGELLGSMDVYASNGFGEGKRILKGCLGEDGKHSYPSQIGSLYSEASFSLYLGEIFKSFGLSGALGVNQQQTRCFSLSGSGELNLPHSLAANYIFTFKQQEGKIFTLKGGFIAFDKVFSSNCSLPVEFTSEFPATAGMEVEHRFHLPIPIETTRSWENSLRDALFTDSAYLNALMEGIGSREYTFSNSLLFEERAETLKSSLRDGLFRSDTFAGSIDYYYGRIENFRNDISDGIFRSFTAKNSIDANYHLSYNVSVFVAGVDISDRVTECSINLYGEEVLSDCEVRIADDSYVPAGSLKVKIENKEFSFIGEEINQDKKSCSTTVWGRSRAAKLYEPFAVKKKITVGLARASEVVSQLLEGFEVVWEIDDFWVKNFSEEGYPLELAKRVVEAIGGKLRAMPDGRIYAVYPFKEDSPSYRLSTILSATLEKRPTTADGVKVVFGGSGFSPIFVEAEKTVAKVGEWVAVKVYSLVPYTFSSTADSFYRESKGIVETVEETITMEDGRGTISKPVLEIVEAPPWLKINGQTVTCDGCRIAVVKYRTVCDVWKVTNYREGKALNCSVETENSVTVFEGSAQRIETIEEPLLVEASAARKRAEQELIKRRGLWRLTATVPFDEELLNCEGLNVLTPWGRGVVVSSSISISSNPLKVLQDLEVILWPQ